MKTMNCDLNEISAFSFESMLGYIKLLLRTGYNPLAQLCRRLHEIYFAKKQIVVIPPRFAIWNEKMQNGIYYIVKIKFTNFTLTCQSPNNVILLKNGNIIKISKMLRQVRSNHIRLFGTKLIKIKGDIFHYPFDSSLIDMWQCKVDEINSNEKQFSLEDIKNKMLFL